MSRQTLYLFISAIFLVFLCVTSDVIFDENGAPIVKLKVGDIRGTIDFSRGGREFYAFRGIPYGHVPERFEVSVEPKSWKHLGSLDNEPVYSAEKYDSECIHFDFVRENVLKGSEDCLYLNVFVPKIEDRRLILPVLFYIHGGGFKSGSSNIYQPKYFMDWDAILVTINYRLGPFGYLNTWEGEYGNMGSKDQVLALKWVQKHIDVFLGDKYKVTIFGESAGASCVHHLVLSPMGKGLFHNAILMSGTANVARAFKDPSNATAAIAQILGCPTPYPYEELSESMIKCLKRVNAQRLLEAQREYHKSLNDKGKETSFVPSLDKHRSPSETFLPIPPTQIMTEGKSNHVPMIIGVLPDEGVFIYGAYLLNNTAKLADLNDDFESHAPTTFDYDDYFPKDHLKEISREIKNFYFPNGVKIGPKTAQAVFDLFSDSFFYVAADQAIRAHHISSRNQVYNYILNYKPQYTYFDKVAGFNQYTSYITHGDDLSLFFNLDMLVPQGENFSKEFIQVSEGVTRAWTTFAETGYPLSWGDSENRWRPASGFRWFSIDVQPEMIDEPYEMALRLEFWQNLYAKYAHTNFVF